MPEFRKPTVDLDKFWAELDALGAADFLPEGVPDDLPGEPEAAVEKVDVRAEVLRQIEQFWFPLPEGYRFDRDEANER